MKRLKSKITATQVIEFLDKCGKFLNALGLAAFKVQFGISLGCFLAIFLLALLRRLGVTTSPNTLVPVSFWSMIVASCLTILFWGHLKLAVSNKLKKRAVSRTHPRFAERLLWFFLKPEIAEDAIEHINAEFEKRRERISWFFAWCWYWWQLVRLAYPLIKELIGMAIKWGMAAWIGHRL